MYAKDRACSRLSLVFFPARRVPSEIRIEVTSTRVLEPEIGLRELARKGCLNTRKGGFDGGRSGRTHLRLASTKGALTVAAEGLRKWLRSLAPCMEISVRGYSALSLCDRLRISMLKQIVSDGALVAFAGGQGHGRGQRSGAHDDHLRDWR